jgi:hypothetical protein
MGNTDEHASQEKSMWHQERWWTSGFYDVDTGIVSFTFVDNGLGVLRSQNVRLWRRVQALALDNAGLLRAILDGKMPSRTGDPNRGKGLPKISQRASAGELANLVIITNDVYAHLGRSEIRGIKRPFRGTLVHWELRRG